MSFTTLVTAEFLDQVTQLQGLTRLIVHEEAAIRKQETLRKKGAEILQYAIDLAYIKISDQKETVVIAPENAPLYIPEWAKVDEERLVIRLPDGSLYTTELHEFRRETNELFYFLHPAGDADSFHGLDFKQFKDLKPLFSPEKNLDKLYQYMEWKQDQLVDRAEMILILADKPEEAGGLLLTDPTFEEGYVLLDRDAFPTKPELQEIPIPRLPQLLLRDDGYLFYLDFVQDVKLDDLRILLGFSLSRVAHQVTSILQKPILLSSEESEGILFFPDGTQSILQASTFNLDQIEYQGVRYFVEPHNVGALIVSILTPEDLIFAIPRLMSDLRENLIQKISGNLLLITVIVFFIGIFLLARISKRMTKPIAQLALASEEIGKGRYENLDLPEVHKRKDEVTVLTHSFHKMVGALQDREKIRGALNKVVSKEVATQILKSDIELGGEERVVTVLFSDIRGFTNLSTHFTPKVLIQMLNKYMTSMCRIIDQTHGVVDKFVGDEIMALYGAPLDMEDQADQALEAATQMIKELKEWNEGQISQGKKGLEIGIGIHTGPVCTGNMGAENRLNYTAIGANVNLASRMCTAAKPMQILVSRGTIDALKDPEKFTFRPVPPMQLKGFDEPVSLFEVV
ncbi:MAG: adenylate/guanylate cyclase domain-containing protein [Chlamydiales bacterium]|nr:adenylate/guanylate cyclase domain-containing protein [Chlamydiales bacterium]